MSWPEFQYGLPLNGYSAKSMKKKSTPNAHRSTEIP